MKNRKLVTLVLTTAFTAGLIVPAFAGVTPATVANAETPIIDTAPATEEQNTDTQALGFVTTVGTVQEVNADNENPTILVKTANDEIEFYIHGASSNVNSTWLVGADGIPTTLKDLQGKEVIVAHSPATTMSIPAKSSAIAVMVKGDVAPNYAVIEKVTKNADGSVTFTTNNGSRLVTINKDAQVSPFMTRNIVTLDELKVGDEVVLYYDIMALSYPAQAHTNKVVLLHPAEPVETEDAAKPSEMVSLRDVANELGMNITWDYKGQTVTLNKNAFSATITIGSTNYGINKMLVKIDQAAEIRDGRTYVPQTFVDELQNQLK